jgi:hypothetical protein
MLNHLTNVKCYWNFINVDNILKVGPVAQKYSD